ncbi:MAG: peptidase domain-containing ABC transporter [Muribaculum sp.]|nr:peptidase domain-containing ABC transporter [Muribaculum sp.]
MKFELVKQKDSMQCGVACLAMICRHFGRAYSMGALSRYCFATAEGVSMLGINEAAEELGLSSKAVKLSVGQLAEFPMPCILHWNQNHFVVCYGVRRSGRQFLIADPAKGRVKCSIAELESHWVSSSSEGSGVGVAMFFEPDRHFFELNLDADTPEKRSIGFLMGYIKQYRGYFSQIVLGLLLGSVLQLVMPFLTQAIVDVGIKQSDINFIWLILLGEMMIVFGRAATDFIRRWLMLHISMRINISLLSDFFIKLLKLPMSFFDTKLMGDLMQRMADHGRVQSFLTSQTLNIAFSILNFIVFGTVLFIYNKLIFAIFLAGSVGYGIWTASFLNRRKILDYELFEKQAINQNKTYQFVTSMQEIKLQDCERRRRWEWEDVQADLFLVQMKSLKLQQTQEAGSIFINEVKNILITVFAATAVIHGEITLGAMLAIQYIVGQLNSPITQFMGFIYSLQDVKISLERINEIHEGRNEERPENNVSEFDSEKSIKFCGVVFKYDPHGLRNIIDHVTFDVPDGKVTAIVGASGCGKTTLIKLMLGYYPVLAGSISVAGHNIEKYNLKWWRRQCGVVMQDGVIFSESIARNIAVDDGEIDVDRLKYAASIANIHDYIEGLPLKYDTQIGRDGIGLSQGQKQRILIARAVYKNPKFIFLDEATNSLDAKNERLIVENLAEFYKGRTVVVVAHRLSTVKDADKIIVFDGGRISEVGNHESLIAQKGVYFNLIKNQLELGA